MQRRIVSIWLPRLPSDRILRARPVAGPFAVGVRDGNAWRVGCLNGQALARGLVRGMPLSEARALCPDLQSAEADAAADARMLETLRRWAMRYCPWVGPDGADGLVLDVTGAAHLRGGEAPMLADMSARLGRAGIGARLGLADTRGAAWALAHHAAGRAKPGIAPPGETLTAIEALPVAGLRLDEATVIALQRLGLRSIGALARAPRAPLARRFGAELLARLDQALGHRPEPVSIPALPPRYSASLALPEPIGLSRDVMAGIARLLDTVCARLARQQAGARALRLTLRRVDRESCAITLRLAAAMRDPGRILPLFARDVDRVDAGFGIDRLRLEVTLAEPLSMRQAGGSDTGDGARLAELVTRIGTRIGLDNILRYRPVDSHLPERSFALVPAADGHPEGVAEWQPGRPRPLRIFPPEPVTICGDTNPPGCFRWRRMDLTVAHATGPERIAPQWWDGDGEGGWPRGIRDYWRVQTHEGWRLWLFHTPQDPGWFVQGEFL